MPLRFVQVDEIGALLLQVPALIDGFERRSATFVDAVMAWLKAAEDVLKRDGLPEASHIAVSRSQLLEASRGLQSGEVKVKGRPTTRKIRDATAVSVLQRCNQVLHDLISERKAVFQDAERISRQLITVAEAKGILDACAAAGGGQAFLQCLQDKLVRDSDLAGIYLHLASLVGKHDVLIFLDRAIPSSS